MNRSMMTLVSRAAAGAVVSFAAVASADVHLTIDQLPAPVRSTVQREVGNGVIHEIEREEEHGGAIVFEVEFTQNGKRWEIDVAPDGALLERDEG